MVHFCRPCKLIFDNNVIVCPICGTAVQQSNGNKLAFTDNGFKNYSGDNSTKVKIDANDILDSLRKTYNTEHENDSTANPSSDAFNDTSAAFNSSADMPHSDNDFFGQFSEQEPDLPHTEPASENTYASDSGESNFSRESASNRHSRSYRNTPYRFNLFSGISSRTIIRIISIVVVIIIIASIWTMRYAILDSIISFIVSLLPVALVLYGIYWLFRSMFR